MTNQTSKAASVQIGTRVYTNLYNKGRGTIYAIHGEQAPASVRVVGGVMHSGGQATFDIVFDSGSVSKQLPECILHGIQWRILDDELATSEEIAEALTNSALIAAAKAAKETEAKNAFARAVETLKSNPEYSHLKQIDGTIYSSKLAVLNIRADLKKAFKGIKFSVRSDHNSVRISWTDGVTESMVDEIVKRYKDGNFNGMEDMYEYSKSPFTDVFGGISYINTHREESPELVQRAIDTLFAEYSGNFTEIEKPTAADFKNGSLWGIYVPGFDQRMDAMIRSQIAKTI